MSEKQWKRLDVMERLEKGQLTGGEAGKVLGLSVRQVRRLKKRLKKKGRDGLSHGNLGRAPVNRKAARIRQLVVKAGREKYAGFNDTHLTEKLAEDEGVEISRSTVRRILRDAGVEAARKRRAGKHHRRRDRKAQAGQMIQWDGSPHAWLEERGPRLCMMGAIDDASGELLPGAHFVEHENAAGYLKVLKALVEKKGLPWAVYQDRHGSLRRNDGSWTLEEELRGKQDPTQVGRALEELGIEAIFALSPQAKGRVERMWGTHQDRLVSELRLVKASTAAEANAVLAKYVVKFNQRFAKPPRDAQPAWRPVKRTTDLNRVCSLRYAATVGNDNAVRLGGRVFDIPPGPGRRSYAKAKVELCQQLDGAWRIYFGDCLVAEAPPELLKELRTLPKRKRSAASKVFRKKLRAA